MNFIAAFLCVCLAISLPSIAQAAELPDVVWDSPSEISSGSMPQGNGEVGLNVWAESDGSVAFYISRTDSWSEICRLLKLGRVRVKLSPDPFGEGRSFKQTLRLRTGDIKITSQHPRVTWRIWVDANAPVVHMEIDCEQPTSAEAMLEVWRTEKHELKRGGEHAGEGEAFSAFGLHGGPNPIIELADTVLPARNNALQWYHRNESSIWADTLKYQGLESLIPSLHDPLLHRTFGGLMMGDGMTSASDRSLVSTKPSTHHHIRIFTNTAQTETAGEWIEATQRLQEQVKPDEIARAAHEKWWNDFWERSWIRISGPQVGSNITEANLPLRLGADSEGQHVFHGDIEDARIYPRALNAEELSNPPSGAVWQQDGSRAFDGKQWLEIANDPKLNPKQAITVMARIRPTTQPEPGMRIIDKCKAGTADGYTFDTYHGLRFISAFGTIETFQPLPLNEWSNVAATLSEDGAQTLYVNGKVVAQQTTAAPSPKLVTQGYALQRFISACAGRGHYPIKFNGSIFTVDAKEVDGKKYNADYRRWGGPYWFQNTRLPYSSVLADGDVDLTDAFFKMYRDALPLAKGRTKIYFNHAGAYFPETMYFWGTWTNSDYGWDRKNLPVNECASPWIRWYWQGGIELVNLMLDRYAYTGDEKFAREALMPVADAVLTYFDQHYKRDANGKIRFEPAQSLETWQDSTNPTPEIAGLGFVIDRLLKLPDGLTDAAHRSQWQRMRGELPPLPMKTEDGKTRVLPAERFEALRNEENTELYTVFPYRLFGVGKPHLEIGQNTYDARQFRERPGWQQDPIDAALLGRADDAKRMLLKRYASKNAGSRFPAFWGPNYDWIPDQDHGSVANAALQRMLLQCEDDKIIVLPAWPKDWDVEFKLHAPMNTTVEGVYRDGKMQKLVVTPNARAKDVTVLDAK
jgi:hypothetical protein